MDKMNKDKIYSPPDKFYDKEEQLVFLAGPIKGTSDWQAEAISIFQASAPELNIANPRRSIEKDKLTDEEKYLQVEWETGHLRLASALGGIMFWLSKEIIHIPGRSYARTSRVEFGEWLTNYKWRKRTTPDNKLKLVLGIDDDFDGRDYIIQRIFADCPEFVLATTLLETCELMIDALKDK